MVYYYTPQLNILAEDGQIVEFIDKSKLVKILDQLNQQPVICIDCETTGLNPLEHHVIMLQLGYADVQLVIDTRSFDFSILKPLLENLDILFVGHNIKFDYNMLKQYGIVLHNVYDTMLADRVIYNGKYTQDFIRKNKRFSLAGVYNHYFEIDIPKTVRLEFQNWGSNPFTLEQILYGAKDVKYPLEIKEIQQYWLDKYNLQHTAGLENNSVLAVADIEYNGIFIATKKWLKIHSTYSLRIKDTLLELDKILIEARPKFEQKAYQLSLFETAIRERYTAINWNSDQQVYKLLTTVFNIYPEDKDGKPGSGTPALLLLDDKPPIVNKLIQYRKESKVISSFGKKFLEKYLYKDGRIRSQFNQMVDTGRMSSRNPNMQQIPSKGGFREAFIALPGKKLITSDYANQEGRIMEDRAEDDDYIEFFNTGDGDAHKQLCA